MGEVLTVKVRKIGSSAGVLIPKERLDEMHYKVGEEIKIAILPKVKNLSGFGMAKGFTIPFVRDKKVRKFK